MRERFCKVCGGWHKLDAWPHNCMPERQKNRSHLSCPTILSDTMPPTQSMVDGHIYTSKSALRATYKPSGNAEGKAYIEVGDDASVMTPKPYKPPKTNRAEIKKAVRTAASRAGLGA